MPVLSNYWINDGDAESGPGHVESPRPGAPRPSAAVPTRASSLWSGASARL